MKIVQYLLSLLPFFERSRINSDIERLRGEVNDSLLPSFKKASQLIQGRDPTSPGAKAINNMVGLEMPAYKRYGFIGAVSRIFDKVPAQLDALTQLVDANFGKDVIRESLSYRQTSILRYLELLSFASEYATRALNRYLANETSAHLNREADIEFAPAELEWLKVHQPAFFQTLKLLDMSAEGLVNALQSIPDVTVVPEKAPVLKATLGEKSLDPLNMGLISARKYPLYHLRMHIAEWEVRKFKRKEEEKKQLEYRILELKEAMAGKQDPRLQQALDYSQGRLQKLTYELDQMSADLT